jgi:hypothetical protein
MLYYLFIAIIFFSSNSIQSISYKKAFDIGKRAYIYAYPLVTMSVTKNSMTDNGKRINQFTHISKFPDYTFKDIVRPNVDTLYSFAWLDLTHGPLILSVPDTKGRYYLMEFMDAWTNVCASIGKRTTGTSAQDFVIVGPHYTGTLPEDMKIITCPTNMVLILARTQTNGKTNYDFVRKIQAGYKLTRAAAPTAHGEYFDFAQHEPSGACPPKPWRRLGRIHSEVGTALGKHKAPVDEVDSMNAETFYTVFARELHDNPPSKQDSALLADFKKIGIIPGKKIDIQSPALNDAIKPAQKEIFDIATLGQRVNGWSVMRDIGTYGTRYLLRAQIAHIGIGANLPEDALYPTAYFDGNGKPLTGKNKYVIHFDKGQLPPANAFWSITMYNAESFLIKNKLDRYALGDRDKLKFNADGSLDIYIQYDSPGKDKESNWLPAPQGEFNVSMRIYWPKESVLNGTWNPPAITSVSP